MSAVEWLIYAIVVVCILATWALGCSRTADLPQCVRDGLPAFLGVLLQGGVLLGSVWVAAKVGREAGSALLGIGCGMVTFVIGTGFLKVCGLAAGI